MSEAPNGVRRWQEWIPTAGLMLTVLVGVITYVVQIANVQMQNAQNSDKIKELERRVAVLVERTTDQLTRITVIQADLREVETQFCASDIVRNLMHANDMRTTSVLWAKVFIGVMPTDNAYYPVICNRGTK